jgi:hypothetical protein
VPGLLPSGAFLQRIQIPGETTMRANRVLLPLALSLIGGAVQADLLYTFDASAQGFTVTSGGALTHVVSGGNGHLSVADIDNADVLLNLPLASGTTDWSSYLGGTLSLDAASLNGQAPSWSLSACSR